MLNILICLKKYFIVLIHVCYLVSHMLVVMFGTLFASLNYINYNAFLAGRHK